MKNTIFIQLLSISVEFDIITSTRDMFAKKLKKTMPTRALVSTENMFLQVCGEYLYFFVLDYVWVHNDYCFGVVEETAKFFKPDDECRTYFRIM